MLKSPHPRQCQPTGVLLVCHGALMQTLQVDFLALGHLIWVQGLDPVATGKAIRLGPGSPERWVEGG